MADIKVLADYREPNHHWNYRVILHHSYDEEGEEIAFTEIRQVHYENNEPVYWESEPISLFGDDVDDLHWKVEQLSEALKKPILDEDVFAVYCSGKDHYKL